MALLDDLDKRREIAERHRENGARLAMSYAVFKTTGQGTSQYGDRVDFGLTFIEKPVVSYGSQVDINDLADLQNVDDTDEVKLPVTAGFVVDWDQDEQDFYIGCWVAVRVNFPTEDAIDSTLQPEIEHHFTFSAIGIKDIPTDITDQDQWVAQ